MLFKDNLKKSKFKKGKECSKNIINCDFHDKGNMKYISKVMVANWSWQSLHQYMLYFILLSLFSILRNLLLHILVFLYPFNSIFSTPHQWQICFALELGRQYVLSSSTIQTVTLTIRSFPLFSLNLGFQCVNNIRFP